VPTQPDKKDSNLFITASYDATSHFETTTNEVFVLCVCGVFVCLCGVCGVCGVLCVGVEGGEGGEGVAFLCGCFCVFVCCEGVSMILIISVIVLG